MYFTYTEEKPISFNPFYTDDYVFDVEKKDSIKTLLLTLWKSEDDKVTKTESGELGSAVNAYIENSNWIKRYKSPAAYKADRYRQPDGTLNFTKIRDEKVMSQSSNSEGEKREFFEWELHYSRAFKTHHVGGKIRDSWEPGM